MLCLFFFKQKTAYEIGTGDWSSDVCSSDLAMSVDKMQNRSYQPSNVHADSEETSQLKFQTPNMSNNL